MGPYCSVKPCFVEMRFVDNLFFYKHFVDIAAFRRQMLLHLSAIEPTQIYEP